MKSLRINSRCSTIIAFWILFVQTLQADLITIQSQSDDNDERNFKQITQLMKNIRSLVGVPLSCMPGFSFPASTYLEVQPEDLVILHLTNSFPSRNKEPLQNEMVELDENEILVICQDLQVDSPFEWPMMRICPEEEITLKDFLVDLKTRGKHLAVPYVRLENEAFLEVNQFRCWPKDGKICSQPAPALPKTNNLGHVGVSDYLPHIYRPKTVPLLLANPMLAKFRTKYLYATTPSMIAASALDLPTPTALSHTSLNLHVTLASSISGTNTATAMNANITEMSLSKSRQLFKIFPLYTLY